jgi:CubicO group peptidase (beta-lactamase class C family)
MAGWLTKPPSRRAASAASASLAVLLAAGLPTHALAQSFRSADSAVRAGIRRGIYPGAVLVVGRRDTILYRKAYGRLTFDRRSPVPNPDSTLWDLASLTKVVATMPVALRLAERGALDLDLPVGRYVPAFGGGAKDSVTVRMLLNHTSGLRPAINLQRRTATRAEALAVVLTDSLLSAPGQRARYSDLNAIVLGLVLEAAGGKPLDVLAREEVFEPIGMEQTLFNPLPAVRRRAAPAGEERRALLRGVVQDPSARRLGGVAGHAGLFGTGADLARYARTWLRSGTTGTVRFAEASTLEVFLARDRAAGTRLLGWDTPDRELAPSSFGSLTSDATYGHTGWTGTQLWIDPARDLFVVLLTNRSLAATRRHSLTHMREIRAAVADAVVRASDRCVVPAATLC